MFYQISDKMRDSLLTFALGMAPEVRKRETAAVKRQREAKLRKRKLLREQKLIAAQIEYANALTYIDMYWSEAGWKNAKECRENFNALGSKTAKLKAVKEQHRIRTVGFGWKDLHHAWSKSGVDYSPEHLLDWLIEKIIPEQAKRGIPKTPPANLPSRGHRQQLGTVTADVVALDKRHTKQEKEFRKGGKRLREQMEADGDADREAKMQPPRPKIDATLIGAKIKQYHEYKERDGTVVGMWCRGEVVGVLASSRVHVKWDKHCLRPGDLPVTKEKFLRTMWNKVQQDGWRMNVDK